MTQGSTGISQGKFRSWERRFAVYRVPPSVADIQRWLNYFSAKDRTIATRILDSVQILSELQIHQGYRQSLNRIEGWHSDPSRRKGRWFFCGYGYHAHESGPAMLRMFAEANHLTHANELFITPLNLPGLKLTAEDTLVFVDDFSGSGKQVTDNWPTMSELIASEARVYLILSALTARAEAAIRRSTELDVVTSHKLGDDANVFAPECKMLTEAEKRRLLSYCERADRRRPKGYGDCGLVFVLSHKTPNNSIPILHVNKGKWRGLFPRYLQPREPVPAG